MTRLDSNQQPVGALGVHAVKMPGQKKFHLLKPHASIGTVYCGAGSRGSGDSRWLEVDQVVQSQRCQVCWVNLPSTGGAGVRQQPVPGDRMKGNPADPDACSYCGRPARGDVAVTDAYPAHYCRQCAEHCQIAEHLREGRSLNR